MNAERLLQHYERIADAPNAIPRLRSFILDLAVRGKLVPQDSTDEPASALLKRIAKEKARLVKEGLARKSDIDPISDEEAPFPVPTNWEWTRLGSIADWGSGSTPPRGNLDLYGGGITWLKSGELNDNRALVGSEETVSQLAIEKGSFRLNRPGDVLIAMYGATIGKVAILAETAVTNQAVCGSTPFEGVFNQFLFLYLLSQREQFHLASEGGAQPNISKVKIVWSPFPLPPLPEQHRIVAKVDELMSLCDQLEAARNEREAMRDRLATASLARLNAPNPETFLADARFALDAFPALTTRPDQIKQIRQTILNLAVRGKLVSQDLNEEPASELLKKIERERIVQVDGGKLRKGKGFAPPLPEKQLFQLPEKWAWSVADQLWDFENGDRSANYPSRDQLVDTGIPFVNAGHLVDGRVSLSDMNYITDAKFRSLGGGKLRQGDQIYCLRGSLGKHAIFDLDRDAAIASSLVILRPVINDCVPYLSLYLDSDIAQTFLRRFDNGTAQPNLSSANLRRYEIPLPPLAEQNRIVAKVHVLMTLCDRLEASLAASADTRRRLLDALLAKALAPTRARDEAA